MKDNLCFLRNYDAYVYNKVLYVEKLVTNDYVLMQSNKRVTMKTAIRNFYCQQCLLFDF